MKEGVECSEDSSAKHFRPLSYKELISAFIVLILGCAVASVYYILECFYSCWILQGVKNCGDGRQLKQTHVRRVGVFEIGTTPLKVQKDTFMTKKNLHRKSI